MRGYELRWSHMSGRNLFRRLTIYYFKVTIGKEIRKWGGGGGGGGGGRRGQSVQSSFDFHFSNMLSPVSHVQSIWAETLENGHYRLGGKRMSNQAMFLSALL